MKNILISLLLIGTLILTGCPSSKTKKAAEVSYQFSGLILDLVKATDRAYTEGLINTAQKDKAVVVLRKMNAGAKALNDIVAELAKDSEVPQDKLAIINKILSREIIDPFLQLLSDLGAAVQAEILRTAIAAIRVAILSISNALGEHGRRVNTGGLQYV